MSLVSICTFTAGFFHITDHSIFLVNPNCNYSFSIRTIICIHRMFQNSWARTFARSFAFGSAISHRNLNDNLTENDDYNFFALIFKIPKLSWNMKFDQNSDLWFFFYTEVIKFFSVNILKISFKIRNKMFTSHIHVNSNKLS